MAQTIVDPNEVQPAAAPSTSTRSNIVDPSAVTPTLSASMAANPAPALAKQAKPTAFEREYTPPPYWGFLPSHLYQQAKEGVESLAAGTYGLAKDVVTKPFAETYRKDVLQPLIGKGTGSMMDKAADAWKAGRKSEATGYYIASYLPFLGPWATGLGEQVGHRDVGGALARGGAQVAAGEVAARVGGRITRAVTEKSMTPLTTLKEATRFVAGAGDTAVEKAERVSADKFAELQERHADKVDIVRTANAEAQAAVKAGQDADQVASRLTDVVSDALPAVADTMTARAKAAYPKVGGEVPRNTLYADLKTVVDDTLKGAGRVPTALGRILDDTAPETGAGGFGKSTGPPIGGRHFNLNDPGDLKAYQNMKAQGLFTPSEISRMEGLSGKPLTFDDLHGMYSELGRELYKGDLPGDSKAALSKGRQVILGRMTEMAKADSPVTVQRFRDAQRGWQVLENVFRNTDAPSRGGSPIARALIARDPITGKLRPAYVRAILTDAKAFQVAKDLLSNYGDDTKDLRTSLDLLKRNAEIAKSAPKTAKVKKEPAAPTRTPFDPTKWREEQLERWAIEGQKLRPYNFMPWRIPYTIIQQIMSRMLSDPEFRRRIAKD